MGEVFTHCSEVKMYPMTCLAMKIQQDTKEAMTTAIRKRNRKTGVNMLNTEQISSPYKSPG